MEIVLNNIADRPASFSQASDDQYFEMVRLVEDSEIKKNIKFDEISVEDVEDPITDQDGNRKEDELGLVYPMIRINDMIIARKNLNYMSLSMEGFMPTISLTLIFEDSNFISKNMPKDGDIISIFIRVDTAALTYLRNEFLITSCNVYNTNTNYTGCIVNLNGRMFIDGFDSNITTRAIAGTSKYVMKEIAKAYNIGFAYNDFDDTNDFMNWLQCKTPTQSYIESVTSHAWKNETSFFKSWIDLYYNLCFVNVNKFLLSTENEEKFDVTFSTTITNLYNLLAVDTSVGKAMLSVKVLTTLTDFKNTPFFIRKWNPINNSSSVSLSNGYSVYTYSFKHNQTIINNGTYDCFEELNNIPAYDQNKTDSFILLRGRTKYDPDKNPENEKARVNYEYINTYVNNVWTGVEYVLDDDDKNRDTNKWSGNVHKNYNRAPQHNNINLNELNKMYLEVECDGLNLQIMKGERIPVLIGFKSELEREFYNTATDNDIPKDLNRFYSGYYIVNSIRYIYNPTQTGTVSPYSTRYILQRREWPTPETIKKDDK